MKFRSMIRQMVLALLVPAGCATAQVTFPLHTGDQWQYLFLDSTFAGRTNVIGETTLTNGFQYTVLQNVFNPLDTGFWRQDSATVYRSVSGVDRVAFAFDRLPGDTIESYRFGAGMVVTVFQQSQYEYVLGKIVNVFNFRTDTTTTMHHVLTHVADTMGIIYAAPAVGRAMMIGGATIDGVTYGSVTDVTAGGGEIPDRYALWQNYPNPFNPGTTIRYAVPERSAVTLSIFNAAGQTVAVPLNGVQREAGTYELRLDASSLASGLYFYRITAAASHRSFTQTRKLLVLR